MKKKKFFSFSLYFWIAFVLLMVSLFFINRAIIGKAFTKIKDSPSFSPPEIVSNDVKETLEGSSSNEVYISDQDSRINDKKAFPSGELEDNIETNLKEIEKNEELSVQSIETPSKKEIQNELTNQKTETEELSRKEKAQEDIPTPNNKHKMRDIDIYFASVSDNGVVTREKCVRKVEHSLSPMVDSLNALLQGPTKEEAKHGIRSFIPADTKLISASIKEETALINLSEDFQFNRYGVEGYNIQLQQIVFTVCSFPTVKSVQFLIEGQKRDFIGSEGVWIGSPLTPDSF